MNHLQQTGNHPENHVFSPCWINECAESSQGGNVSLKQARLLIFTSYLCVSSRHVPVSPWPLHLLVPKSSDRTILLLFPSSSFSQPHQPLSIFCHHSVKCDYAFSYLLQYFLSLGHKKTSNGFICSSMEPSWLICFVSCWSSLYFKAMVGMAKFSHLGFTADPHPGHTVQRDYTLI